MRSEDQLESGQAIPRKPRTPMSAAHDRRREEGRERMPPMVEEWARIRIGGVDVLPMPRLPEDLRFTASSKGTFVSGDVYRFEMQLITVKEV